VAGPAGGSQGGHPGDVEGGDGEEECRRRGIEVGGGGGQPMVKVSNSGWHAVHRQNATLGQSMRQSFTGQFRIVYAFFDVVDESGCGVADDFGASRTGTQQQGVRDRPHIRLIL